MKHSVDDHHHHDHDDHQHDDCGDRPTGHMHGTRFMTAEEVVRLRIESGEDLPVDPEEIGLRLRRQMLRLRWPGFGPLGEPLIFGPTTVTPNTPLQNSPIGGNAIGWVEQLPVATLRPRRDHRSLTPFQRAKFKQALEAAYKDGSYTKLASTHANMSHRMHNMGGLDPIGGQRFLPWHRLYLLELEDLLRSKQPDVTIPYWDYANDPVRPDWVGDAPDVWRGDVGEEGGSLPSQASIDSILSEPTYLKFTDRLEFEAHNDVHVWLNGTVSTQETAAKDPIFWLLHANVDRIWDKWQLTHTGTPILSGANAILDPWGPKTAADVDDIVLLGYSYRERPRLFSGAGKTIIEGVPVDPVRTAVMTSR